MKENNVVKANKKNVIELIRENKDFNLEINGGFIYMIGGFLGKTIGERPFYYDKKLKIWKDL